MPPSYHHWSPWIGPQTRRSDVVLSTECEKIQAPKISNDGDDRQMTEEQLADELLNLKVNSDSEIKLQNTSFCTDKICLTETLAYKCISTTGRGGESTMQAVWFGQQRLQDGSCPQTMGEDVK